MINDAQLLAQRLYQAHDGDSQELHEILIKLCELVARQQHEIEGLLQRLESVEKIKVLHA